MEKVVGGVCLIACIAASGETQGADAAPLASETDYLGDVPVVLTASRLAQPQDEVPAAVTVIDRQMIRDSGARDLSEVFRLVPGMVVSYHSGRFYISDSTVSYHGLSDNYARSMQVLIDGRSVYSPLFGGVIWSDIPLALDDIERIEVIRGPDSASYGANSFMGVINIITRHSADVQGAHVFLAKGGRYDEAQVRYGGMNSSGSLTYRMTVGLRNDPGEDTYIVNPLATTSGWNLNKFDDKKIHLVNFRADYRATPSDEIEFQFGYNGGDRQEGEFNSSLALSKRADNQFELLQWKRLLASGGELKVQFYHSQEATYTEAVNLAGMTPAGAPYKADVIAHRYDLEAQHTFSPSERTRLVWGGSVRLDTVYAPFYHDPDGLGVTDVNKTQTFRLSRLFANLEWKPWANWVFNAGAMAEHNSYTGTDITPRLAANWHFLPGQTLRVSASTATRTPTDFEKVRADPFYALGVLSKKLETERVSSSEIGYMGKFSGLNVDFRLFRDAFSHLIVENGASLASNDLNPGSAVVKGFETQLKWDVGPRTRLVYSLSHSKASSLNQTSQTYTNSVPGNVQSLMLTHSFDSSWRASLMGYQTGEAHFLDTDRGPSGNYQYFVATHRRWDGRVAYNFKTAGGNGELAVVVQNLADAQYFEFRHDNQPPGRSAWLTLRLDY